MSKRILAPCIAALLCSTHLYAADLLEVYGLARQSDPVLAAADATRRSVAENLPQARAALLPELSSSVSYTKSDITSSGVIAVDQPDGTLSNRQSTTNAESRGLDLSLNVQQSVYDHANYTRLKSARAVVSRAEHDYQAAVDALAVRVAEAYFAVLTATDALAFAQAEEKAVGRQLEQAEQRFEVGLTAITDVHEARARHDSSTAAVILQENALDDARVALSEITGTFIEQVAGLQAELPLDRPQPAAWQDWVDLAMQHNPVVAAAMRSSEAADFGIDTARAAYLPRLSFTGRYNDGQDWGQTIFDSGARPRSGDGESDGFNVGLTLTIPLDVSGRTQSVIRQSVADHQGALDNLELQRRSITRQTRNAYRAVIAGISEVQARKQALVSAQSALEATEAGFEVGTRTIVDVLLSQQVLFQAQRDYSNSRHNFILNGLRLKRAAGVIEVADLERINVLLQR